MSCTLANGNCQTYSGAAAKDNDEEKDRKTDAYPAVHLTVRRSTFRNAHVWGSSISSTKIITRLVEEYKTQAQEEEHNREEGKPNDAASKASHQAHEYEASGHSENQGNDQIYPILYKDTVTFFVSWKKLPRSPSFKVDLKEFFESLKYWLL